MLRDYHVYMSDLIANCNAELATEDGPKSKTYTPHHKIYHPEKPGKLRVVFDCSAEYKEVLCLNDILLQGPDITNNLVCVLLRFRRESIAVHGDIHSMFHQVKIPLQDIEYFPFL